MYTHKHITLVKTYNKTRFCYLCWYKQPYCVAAAAELSFERLQFVISILAIRASFHHVTYRNMKHVTMQPTEASLN